MALHIFDRDGFEYTRPHEATFSGKKNFNDLILVQSPEFKSYIKRVTNLFAITMI